MLLLYGADMVRLLLLAEAWCTVLLLHATTPLLLLRTMDTLAAAHCVRRCRCCCTACWAGHAVIGSRLCLYAHNSRKKVGGDVELCLLGDTPTTAAARNARTHAPERLN